MSRFVNGDSNLNSKSSKIEFNLYVYCTNDFINLLDPNGKNPWNPPLTLFDYKCIHDKVADEVALQINFLARREVYVTGTKGNGRLDVYDCLTNSYYEIKSDGSAYTNSTKTQMEKYDNAHTLISVADNVGRGTKRVSGTFYYGAWQIEYYSVFEGLVAYSHYWDQKRYDYAVGIAAALAIVGITVAVIATEGAASPLYTLVPMFLGG